LKLPGLGFEPQALLAYGAHWPRNISETPPMVPPPAWLYSIEVKVLASV